MKENTYLYKDVTLTYTSRITLKYNPVNYILYPLKEQYNQFK